MSSSLEARPSASLRAGSRLSTSRSRITALTSPAMRLLTITSVSCRLLIRSGEVLAWLQVDILLLQGVLLQSRRHATKLTQLPTLHVSVQNIYQRCILFTTLLVKHEGLTWWGRCLPCGTSALCFRTSCKTVTHAEPALQALQIPQHNLVDHRAVAMNMQGSSCYEHAGSPYQA